MHGTEEDRLTIRRERDGDDGHARWLPLKFVTFPSAPLLTPLTLERGVPAGTGGHLALQSHRGAAGGGHILQALEHMLENQYDFFDFGSLAQSRW